MTPWAATLGMDPFADAPSELGLGERNARMPLRTFIFAMTDPPGPVEDSALFLPAAAGNRLQRLEVGGGGRQGLAFDGAVVADQLDTARPPVLPPVCAETSGSVKLWLISATSSQARL